MGKYSVYRSIEISIEYRQDERNKRTLFNSLKNETLYNANLIRKKRKKISSSPEMIVINVRQNYSSTKRKKKHSEDDSFLHDYFTSFGCLIGSIVASRNVIGECIFSSSDSLEEEEGYVRKRSKKRTEYGQEQFFDWKNVDDALGRNDLTMNFDV